MKYAIGLMSGTSLDGLDICHVKFITKNNYQFNILKTETIKYTKFWKDTLQNAHLLSDNEIQKLDLEYGRFLGNTVKKFIKKNNITQLDFIASHGHTIFHQPENNYTLQIGNGMEIKNIVHKTTINDFRTQDVVLGGQGAPLVPIGDELAFIEFDACINIGGFSNISFKKNGKRIAFDICPVNIILNLLAKKLEQEFDKNGKIARNGICNIKLLKKLNNIAFYHLTPPKSLGREWVEKEIYPLLVNHSIDNLLSTFTHHIAFQIATVLNKNHLKKILFTGGGAYNIYLMELIQKQTQSKIIIPKKELIEYKEALIFALLGLLRLENKINILASVTGAKYDHSSGVIWT